MKKNKNKGMTLISLVVTIIILIILAAVTIRLVLGDNGIINKAQTAADETTKEAATEAMNFKITSAQIETYGKEQRMPTLQELADDFCEDEDFEYVELATKKTASLSKIEVGENESIFTKLKEYPYEFEINSSLQLASIDGIQVATSDTITIDREEYEQLKADIAELKAKQGISKQVLWEGKMTTTGTISLQDSIENYDMLYIVGQFYKSETTYGQTVMTCIMKEDYNIISSVDNSAFMLNGSIDVQRRIMFGFPNDNQLEIGGITEMRLLKVYGIKFN